MNKMEISFISLYFILIKISLCFEFKLEGMMRYHNILSLGWKNYKKMFEMESNVQLTKC
jgi:hypothetical protein